MHCLYQDIVDPVMSTEARGGKEARRGRENKYLRLSLFCGGRIEYVDGVEMRTKKKKMVSIKMKMKKMI